MYKTGNETVLYSTKEVEKLQFESTVKCQFTSSGMGGRIRVRQPGIKVMVYVL
jgi:hypothetical protein